MRSNVNTHQVDLFLPTVEVKKRLKKIVVTGRSRMPDAGEYYNDFANTLSDHYVNFKRTLILEFYFDYINTGSSKWLLFLVQFLDTLKKERGGLIEIIWKYDQDDETIQETGEVLKANVSIPIVLKAI